MRRVQIILLFYFVSCEVSVGFNSFPQVITTNEEPNNHLLLNDEFEHSSEKSEMFLDSSEMNSDQHFLQDKKLQDDIKKYEKYLSLLGIKQPIDPDVIQETFMTTPQLIRKYQYDVEVHHVTTTDGYILELHRIRGGPKSPIKDGKKPVFLMHGLLDSSGTWVIMRPTHGLAYILADEGYDVWMGNARGSRYSRRHIKYNPDGWRFERKFFWAFSWHEIGVIDVPEMIDYVLARTGYEKLQYIGHSQGTTAFFVMCSERPEYNDKIILMNALAPVAYVSNLKSPIIRVFTPFLNSLETLESLLGIYEFLPSNELFALGGQVACREEAFTQSICENILFLIAGYKSDQINQTMLPIVLGHIPAGASTNQMIHYGQGVRSGEFRQYDHGFFGNLRKYGQRHPPSYNIENVKAKVAVHFASDDWLSVPKDVERLTNELPNKLGPYLIPHKTFNHLDFLWGVDVRSLLYNDILNLLKQFHE